MGKLVYDDSEPAEGYELAEEVVKYLRDAIIPRGGVATSNGIVVSNLLDEISIGISLFVDGK